jgi:4-hydroxy-4-methyl-2-oxoglutarate aldolase
MCAGALVNAGDVIIADDDGVVVVARAAAREVAELAAQRARKEDATRERLARGELGLDIYGLRSKLSELKYT